MLYVFLLFSPTDQAATVFLCFFFPVLAFRLFYFYFLSIFAPRVLALFSFFFIFLLLK